MKPQSVRHIAGFTLVELIVTIAVIGIVVAIAVPSFNSWSAKSNVEAQVRQMGANIELLRIRALTMKKRHSITLNATSYVFKMYSSDAFTSAADMAASGTVIPGGSYPVKYPLYSNSTGTQYAGTILEIDERGMNVSSVATIYILGSMASGATPNCLTIHTIRVNPGKISSSGVCNDI